LKHIVIVGFEAAGLTAASAARVTDRGAKITAIERLPYAIYHPCGIPFAIGGEIKDIADLIESAPQLPGVEVRTSAEATAIDPKKKTVTISSLEDDETLKYDSLIIATGSYAFKPPIPGIELKGVHVVRTVEDGRAIMDELKNAKKAVVIGGGVIGIEVGAALQERGLKVTIIEMLPSLLPGMLDPDMVETVAERLCDKDIQVICGKSVKEIRGDGKVKSVVVEEKEIPTDLVIVAAGVKPETKLAEEAGIELGETGGIKTDNRLQTNIPDVYAAGDCAESYCPLTKRPILSQLATTAIRMGKVAGVNAAGGNATYAGTLNTVVTSAYGLEVASTGLTTHAAKEAGFAPLSARTRVMSRPKYYPGAEPIIVKLLVLPVDHRIIGGQVVGTDGAAERVNMLALAIQKRMTVEELSKIEYCYAPPVCDCNEPLVVAAEAAIRKLG